MDKRVLALLTGSVLLSSFSMVKGDYQMAWLWFTVSFIMALAAIYIFMMDVWETSREIWEMTKEIKTLENEIKEMLREKKW